MAELIATVNVPLSSGLPNFPQGASGVVFEQGVIAPANGHSDVAIVENQSVRH